MAGIPTGFRALLSRTRVARSQTATAWKCSAHAKSAAGNGTSNGLSIHAPSPIRPLLYGWQPSRASSRSSAVDIVDPTIGMSEDAIAFHQVAAAFAASSFAPHAAKWDKEGFFPEDALRDAAKLGFGGLYVQEESGGSGMSREDSMGVVEALAAADTSTTAYLTIHNMCAW
jgi:hypothetical protein